MATQEAYIVRQAQYTRSFLLILISSIYLFLLFGCSSDNPNTISTSPTQTVPVISRVSTDSSSVQANNSSYSEGGRIISDDNRYAVFYSDASNLVAGDTNGVQDIFMKDLTTGTTTRVSVDSAGNQSSSMSYAPRISANGRYVVFGSMDSFGVTDVNGPSEDVFVRDLTNGTTNCVSLNSTGTQTGDNRSMYPEVSSNGLVTFQSEATDLIPGGSGGFHIFVRNLSTNNTIIVSRATGVAGAIGNSDSYGPHITPDGRYVAFSSLATNLVLADTNGTFDVFVRDLTTNQTACASVDLTGKPGNGYSDGASISADGRYIAFFSNATNLMATATNGKYQVFVRDTIANTTVLASVDSSGIQGDGDSMAPSISADGRYVAFQSDSGNLVAGDTNSKWDIFVRDLVANTTIRISVDDNGAQSNDASTTAVLSADGKYVLFTSQASNLVSGDTNLKSDVFMRKVLP